MSATSREPRQYGNMRRPTTAGLVSNLTRGQSLALLGQGVVALLLFIISGSILVGIAVMGLAIMALPAMIGFAIPVAGKLASGGGGGMATGAAVAGTVAAGAISNGGSNRHTNTQNGPVGANPAAGAGPAGKGGGAGSAGKSGANGAPGATVAGSAGAAGSTAAAGATGGISKGIETGAKVVQEVSKQTKSAAEGAAGNGDKA